MGLTELAIRNWLILKERDFVGRRFGIKAAQAKQNNTVR
jgi:hypothetical protein